MRELTQQLTASILVTALLSGTTAALVHGQSDSRRAPYDLEKFRSVLDDSKLQAPKSSPTLISRGKFAGASNEYFFLDPTGQYMTFTVEGDSCRSELRQESGDWDTASKKPQRLIARVKVFVPQDKQLESFTFLQIHDKKNGDKGLNKPLLRVTRRDQRRGKQDHLWAAIRTPKNFDKPISLSNLASKHVDLGPRPKGFFDVEVRVQNSKMTVTIDRQTKVNMDVSYWDGLPNYFKAGVYNQDPGRSKVQFQSLRFSDSDDDPANGSNAKAVKVD